ncbi:MAG: hypothetical protein GF401_12795 [Chitinivibrionales bacterium]|nr:hypothetical protein [Chitinivibrionales bacterium]
MKKTIALIMLSISLGFGQNYKLTNLKSTEVECDLLIVCKSFFEQKANEHAQYRINNTLDEVTKPGIAILEDIYTTFPDSTSQEGKLKQFLLYTAEQWKGEPRFVLLVGEPPAYGENETPYSCPSYFVPENSYTDTDYVPIDDWLLKSERNQPCFAALGRLPVRTEIEYSSILQKTKQFESNLDFTSVHTLSIYDDDMIASECNVLDFYEPSFSIESKKSSIVPNTWIQMIEYDADAEYRKRFLEDTIAHYINWGTSIVSYFGMGGENIWSDEAVLQTDSIIEKISDARAAIFLSFTSNSNRFQERDNSIGSKLLLAPNKGAVVAIGAPNLGQYASSLEQLQTNFWNIFTDHKTIGGVFYSAKAKVANSSIERMNLLGDPSLMISVDSIGFAMPDTITANPGSQIQIKGTIPAANGILRVYRYSLPIKFERTTECGTEVSHYRSPFIIDTTDIQINSGTFTQNLIVNFDIDSVVPVKLMYYATIEGKKYYGAKFVIEGEPSILASSRMPGNQVLKQYEIKMGTNGCTLRNIGFDGTIQIFQANGRLTHSYQVQNRQDLLLMNLQSGLILIRTISKDGVSVRKLNQM